MSTITLSSYVALVCSGMLMSIGCGTISKDHVDSSQVALEIRFQDDDAANLQSSADLLRFASQAAGPTNRRG